MKSRIPLILSITLFGAILFSVVRCKKDKAPANIDQELYQMSVSTEGFVYYKNSSALLPRSSGSGHSQAFLKTRYNAIAATMLDADGKIIPGAQFPEGSLVVKELWPDENTLNRYAILFKDSDNEYADANGWVWGYMNSDVSVAVSAVDKGEACINCHSQSEHIDYMLMNKFFP